MGKGDPRVGVEINEVAEFAGRYLPARAKALAAKYPDLPEMESPGLFMGSNDPNRGEQEDSKARAAYNEARLEVVKSVLPDVRIASRCLIKEIVGKVRLGGRVRFFSEVVTLLTSTSLVGSVFIEQPTAAKALGVLTFISAAASLSSDFVMGLNNPHLANAKEILDDLIRNDAVLSKIDSDVALALRFRIAEQIEQLLTDANKAVEYINRVSLSLHGMGFEERVRNEIALGRA